MTDDPTRKQESVREAFRRHRDAFHRAPGEPYLDLRGRWRRGERIYKRKKVYVKPKRRRADAAAVITGIVQGRFKSVRDAAREAKRSPTTIMRWKAEALATGRMTEREWAEGLRKGAANAAQVQILTAYLKAREALRPRRPRGRPRKARPTV